MSLWNAALLVPALIIDLARRDMEGLEKEISEGERLQRGRF
jgi:hypothetical protein